MRKILVAIVLTVAVSACKGPSRSESDKMTSTDVNAEITIDEPVGNSEAKSMDLTLASASPPRKAGYVKFPTFPVIDDYGDQASKTGKPSVAEKKIIKEGEIRFKTADINETRKSLYASLKKLGGYVAEESENNDSESGQKEITLQTRIPSKNFDLFLSNVSENAESIDSKNISIRDVTTQFIDVTTQLANKKKLEERYLELLKKGNKISDLLEIENKLTEIRSDIESTQGQLNYLSKQVEYSSLNITFYSRQTVQDNGQSFGYKIKKALTGGWHTLSNLFFSFIEWWPIWLILAGLVYLFRRWLRKRRAANS